MKRRLVWLVIVLIMGVVLAACGGGGDNPPPVVDSGQTETAQAALDTRPTFPPTWTPAPTEPTTTPRATLAYSYTRPTATLWIPPTYTPSPVPPTLTPVATRVPPMPVATQAPVAQTLTLDIPAALLNQVGQTEFAAGTMSYLASAPGFNFQPPDTVIVIVSLRTDLNDPTNATSVVIRALVSLEDSQIALTQVGTNRLGETTATQLPLVDTLLDMLELRIDTAIQDYFASMVPGGISYEITAIEVKEGSIGLEITATVQPDASPDAPAETPAAGSSVG